MKSISKENVKRMEVLGEENIELSEVMLEGQVLAQIGRHLEVEIDKKVDYMTEGKLFSTPINIDLRRHQIKNMLG